MGIYDLNEYLPEKRRALEAWTILLQEIVSGKKAGNNVVAINPASNSVSISVEFACQDDHRSPRLLPFVNHQNGFQNFSMVCL